ncbi:AhpD family alkylhydroperoxidase [Oxalobacteraceae bacterium GrIS 2.11]
MDSISISMDKLVFSGTRVIFDPSETVPGTGPNLFATLASSEHALIHYLTGQDVLSRFNGKAREVINLIVSQENNCEYSVAAHMVTSKMGGFTNEQILEIRTGRASFDARLDALARLVKNTVAQRGLADVTLIDAFFAAGWTAGNLVDAIIFICDKTITNYLITATQVLIDAPAGAELPD